MAQDKSWRKVLVNVLEGLFILLMSPLLILMGLVLVPMLCLVAMVEQAEAILSKWWWKIKGK